MPRSGQQREERWPNTVLEQQIARTPHPPLAPSDQEQMRLPQSLPARVLPQALPTPSDHSDTAKSSLKRLSECSKPMCTIS